MLGSAIYRQLQSLGYKNLIGRSSSELDLTNYPDVEAFLRQEKPDIIITAAAKVGGILANMQDQVNFLQDNLYIGVNLVKAAYTCGIKKFINIGSSCIYPKACPQPMIEEYMLTGPLEPTNEGYALAKIAVLKLCEYYQKQHGMDYVTALPCNLYGQGDNFDPKTSHVISGLIRRMHTAKQEKQKTFAIWGSGTPKRQFLYVDDAAAAICLLINNKIPFPTINVGSPSDITIKDLAIIIKDIVQFEGDLTFDTSMPDGMKQKLMDISKITSLGWQPKISITDGIKKTYNDFLSKHN